MQAQLDSRSPGNWRLMFVMDKPAPQGVPFAPPMSCPTCTTENAIVWNRVRKSGAQPRQLAFPPVVRLAILIKLTDVVTVQCLHDANPREHRLPAERRMTCVSTMLERTVA